MIQKTNKIKELNILLLSEKKYTKYVFSLLAISILLLYIFVDFLPWEVSRINMILSLVALFLYTGIARYIIKNRFAKIGLYIEIPINVIAITALTYFSGGIVSPFSIFFIIPIAFAIFLIGSNFGWVILAFSVASLGSLVFFEPSLEMGVLGRVAFFLIYSILLIYITSILFFLKNVVLQLEKARKEAQVKISHLEEIAKRLKELDRTKNEFMTRTSHQLRTPVNKLSWGLQSMIQGGIGAISEEQKSFLEKMQKSSGNLIKLVEELLDIREIEEGISKRKKKKFDLLSAIKNIISEYSVEIKEKSLSVEVPKGEVYNVFENPERLDVVLRNIIENAIQYNKKNGKIWIDFTQKSGKLFVGIHDTGIGIPKEDMPSIFKRFYRGSNAALYVADGSGLGLSLSRDIMEKQGGRILIDSTEGVGTNVTLVLSISK